MLLEKNLKIKLLIILFISAAFYLVIKNNEKLISYNILTKKYFAPLLDLNNGILDKITVDGKKTKVVLTLNDNLEKYIKKHLKRWHPDYASVVIMKSDGSIISLIGYDRKNGFNKYLPFTNVHPAASLFKIITASALLEKGIKENKKIAYKGKGTTLYKYQLRKIANNRWVRHTSFSDAFAKSNNVVMSKLAIKNLSISNISQMAHKFKFNEYLMDGFKLLKSNYLSPNSQYSLAEISSGFNRTTLISPVHAASILQTIMNDGKFNSPYFIKKYQRDGISYNKKIKAKRIISQETVESLRKMMSKTLYMGTARKYFKSFWRKHNKQYLIGGKTGSIKGGIPYGKNDWFAFFIKNKANTKGIAIATLLINKKKWYVKSTQLTRVIADYLVQNNLI